MFLEPHVTVMLDPSCSEDIHTLTPVAEDPKATFELYPKIKILALGIRDCSRSRGQKTVPCDHVLYAWFSRPSGFKP